VVTHHPQPPLGDGDVELLGGRGVPGIQVVRLAQRNAVDGHPALGVTALDPVAADSDDPFDQVFLVVGRQQADEGESLLDLLDDDGVVLLRRGLFVLEPTARVLEDGITNAWTRNVFRTRAIRTATPTRRGISLTAPRLLRRFTLRWSLRRSARERPPEGLAERRTPVGSRLSAAVLDTPRGLPRLPMRALRCGHARVGVGTVQTDGVAGGPDDPVGPSEDIADGDHAAAR
jgi:hypothetical protein